MRLSAEGMAPAHLALLLETAADAAETRMGAVSCELVWTGPEAAVSHSRDTAVVVEGLFSQAQRSVLVRARHGISVPSWVSRRPPGKARGARIPGVCKRRATQPDGMHRRPGRHTYSMTGP
jgi:hypothetical protein